MEIMKVKARNTDHRYEAYVSGRWRPLRYAGRRGIPSDRIQTELKETIALNMGHTTAYSSFIELEWI